MTVEEFGKIVFHFASHLNMGSEHATTYLSEDGRFGICDHQPYRRGVPYGRCHRHWRIDGKVYKSWDKFVKALAEFEYKPKTE